MRILLLLLMVTVMAASSWRPALAKKFLPGKTSSNAYRRIFTPHTFIHLRHEKTSSLAIPKQQDESLLSSYSSLSPYNNSRNKVSVAFPGGGLFFYWQAGVIAYLQDQGYNLSSSNILLSGASAGALSATLAKTGVSPYDATTLALQMSDDAGIWDRPLGLQGVWGNIIRDWLDQLLPIDAAERAQDGLQILVTPVPSFGKKRISNFMNRQDLIDANMASVHLPWFLDGKITTSLRGEHCIDGSFLARPYDYFDNLDVQSLLIDFNRDPVMRNGGLGFVKVVSKQTIWDILEQGKSYAKIMDGEGCFDNLPRN